MEITESIHSVKNGQSEAFEDIVIRFQKPIFSFLLGMGISSLVIEDIAQDVFISAYINIKSYDSNKSEFSTWLFSIAKNKAINHIRRNKIKLFFGFVHQDTDITINAEVVMSKKQEYKLVLELVNALPSEYKTSCLLYFFNDLKIEQISVIENCSPGTIKSRLFRAKKILKNKMEENYYEK